MEPSYRKALGRSWSLVWHHKIVWVLGLLSIFVGELGLSNFVGELWAKFLSPNDSWWPAGWGAIHITNAVSFFWFLWIVAIVGALALFVVVAAVCAEAALIFTVQHYYRFHTVPKFAVAWHKATKHFWGVFAVNVLEKFLLATILAVVVSLLPLLPGGILGLALTILSLAVSIFLALFVVLTAIYSLGYIIHDSIPVVEAILAAWELLRAHVLVSLELTAMLLATNLLVAWIVSLGSIVALIPSFILSVVGGASGLETLIKVAAGLNVFLFTVFIVVLGAIFNAFTTSAWMYLFMHMHHEGLTSRLQHFARRLFKRSA